jgi:hypothetical protein
MSLISVAAFEATGLTLHSDLAPLLMRCSSQQPVAELGVLAHPRHVVRLGRLI